MTRRRHSIHRALRKWRRAVKPGVSATTVRHCHTALQIISTEADHKLDSNTSCAEL